MVETGRSKHGSTSLKKFREISYTCHAPLPIWRPLAVCFGTCNSPDKKHFETMGIWVYSTK